MKECKKCKVSKIESDYSKNGDGLYSICKQCVHEKHNSRYIEYKKQLESCGVDIICKYCKNMIRFDDKVNTHTSTCSMRQLYLKEFEESILTKDYLQSLFDGSNTVSMVHRYILKEYKIYYNISRIIKYCKKIDIKTPTIKESVNNSNTRLLYESTCMDKYGAKNALSKDTSAYKKRNETVKDRYGVENVFQLPEVIDKCEKTSIEKYGYKRYTQTEMYNKSRNCGRRSKIHIKIEEYLTSIGESFESDKVHNSRFLKYNKILKREYKPIPDILLKEKRIVFEIYGDRWHGNPKFYKEDDVLPLWKGSMTVKDKWDFDNERRKQIESFGYKVYILWEYDILKNFEEIKENISEIVKLVEKDTREV